jgi:uncharacterized membrane protein
MKRYITYLVFYSIGGYLLERIINLLVLSHWLDNRVFLGFYQPMYGLGVLFCIFLLEQSAGKIKVFWFFIISIVITAFVETVSWWSYYILTGNFLWNYKDAFPCLLPYTCFIPTTLFSILNLLVVYHIHPIVKTYLDKLHPAFFYPTFSFIIFDLFWTLYHLLQ